MKNLDPRVKKSAKKILNLATRSKRSMQVNQMNYVRTAKFINTEAKRISQPKIDKKKLKKLFNTDFSSIASANSGSGGGFGLPGFDLPFGRGGGRRGGRPGRKPPSRRAQQRYRRRFGNRAGNRRFGRLPQFGRGRGIRVPRAGGVLGVAMAGLEYGGRVSEGQTQTQAIAGTAASTAGGIAGAMGGAKGGAAVGALIGSIVPGAGTALGAAIGGLIGGVAGGMAGSSLAGGAADKLTGVNQPKVIGKEDSEKKQSDKLSAVQKDSAFMETLNRFDDLLDRFGKISVSGGGESEEGGPGIAFTSFTGKTLPSELNPVVLDLKEKFNQTGETQSALTPKGFVKIEATAPNRLGIFGGPDMTPRISYNEKLTIKSNKQNAVAAEQLFTAANLPATLSPFAGAKKGAVQPRVVTKSTGNPATVPVIPTTPGRPGRKIRKRMSPTETQSPISGPGQNIFESQTPPKIRTRDLLREPTGSRSPTTPQANQAKREAESQINSGGVSDQALNQVKAKIDAQAKGDKQSVGLAEDLLSRPANQRGPLPEDLKTTRIKNEDGTYTEIRAPQGTDPKEVNVKSFGNQSSAAGIESYTLFNGPENNTIIIQSSGGGMPPPPAQSPPMIAQAPPLDMQMMGGGPSKLDQAHTLNKLITFTKLTS